MLVDSETCAVNFEQQPYMPVACGRIHQGHERFSDDPQGRQIATNDFKCLAAHLQYSLPIEALNVIVELCKSLPVPFG